MPDRPRRWNGWGFEGESVAVPPLLGDWLEARLGRGVPLWSMPEAEVDVPAGLPLPDLGCEVSAEPADRVRHARGMSFPDLVALRGGNLGGIPDGVARPTSTGEVLSVLRAAAATGVAVVVRGGGTSVVGGVNVPPPTVAGARPTVVLSTARLTGLVSLDAVSRLATFRAGTVGPEVEAALAPVGLRLGHEPQSFELSTVGGWVAARSAGHRSTGVGAIESLVAGLSVATSRGLWRLAAQPASASGPDLRQLVLGSEGRFGVIVDATLRLSGAPERQTGVVVLLPSWSAGIEVARCLLQSGPAPEVLRLSDVEESAMAVAVLHLPGALRWGIERMLRLRRYRQGCLLLLGWTGDTPAVLAGRRAASEAWARVRGLALGSAGWRSWLRDRFRHPYLRDALLDAGWAIDTLETAAPWSGLAVVYEAVRGALRAAAGQGGHRAVVLCHLSHAYRDGASLYFTFLWPLRVGRAVDDWWRMKSAATDALMAAGGTLSHHHGVGAMHAPWLQLEAGDLGRDALRAVAKCADPGDNLNAGVLVGAGEC